MIRKIKKSSLIHIVALSVILLVWNLLGFIIKKYFGNVDSIPSYLRLLMMFFLHSSFLVYILFFIWDDINIKKELQILFKKKNLFWGIAIGLISLFSVLVIVPFLPELPHSAVDLISKDNKTLFILFFIYMSLYAPIVEELMFREFLWNIFSKKKMSVVFTLIITSLLFALFHFELIRLPLLFLGGVIYGLPRIFTGRIDISLFAHIVNNSIVLIVSIVV